MKRGVDFDFLCPPVCLFFFTFEAISGKPYSGKYMYYILKYIVIYFD